jgi:hypothetical protein
VDGFGRPWIERDEQGTCQQYYSIRVRSIAAYRLGYARPRMGSIGSETMRKWGCSPTPGSFDADGMSYSALIKAHGSSYCFYSGKDFGKDGVAVAKLV